MLTIERDRASNYSKVYETIYSPALFIFEKMLDLNERKQNNMKMKIYQRASMSLQHMEGDNKDDLMQALYARRVKQLRLRNTYFLSRNNLDQRTTELKEICESINFSAKTHEQLDKNDKERRQNEDES